MFALWYGHVAAWGVIWCGTSFLFREYDGRGSCDGLCVGILVVFGVVPSSRPWEFGTRNSTFPWYLQRFVV